MEIIVIMILGIVVGATRMTQKSMRYNDKVQLVSIIVLVFSMGTLVGGLPDLKEQLVKVGIESVIFAILPMMGSLIVVYMLTKKERQTDD